MVDLDRKMEKFPENRADNKMRSLFRDLVSFASPDISSSSTALPGPKAGKWKDAFIDFWKCSGSCRWIPADSRGNWNALRLVSNGKAQEKTHKVRITTRVKVEEEEGKIWLKQKEREGGGGDLRFKCGRSRDEEETPEAVLDLDLLSFGCPDVSRREGASPVNMGQKSSSLWSRPKISLTWALRNDIPIPVNNNNNTSSKNNNGGKACSFEAKPVRKHNNLSKNSNVVKKQSEVKRKFSSEIGEPKKSEVMRIVPKESRKCEEGRSLSPASSTSTSRVGRRRRLRRPRPRCSKSTTGFGYEIRDVDEFLTNASLENPGNIPMVLSRPCVLYETHTGGPQREVSLPLGMVVNGVLKNKAWLYAQTPHGEEGYVPYACCLPLGILPAPSRPQPCWDTQTDIFPRPTGNKTDTEKMRDGTRSECGARSTVNYKRIRRDSGERSVDGLYLRASRKPPVRHTLLVIGSDYTSPGRGDFSVCKGDVVTLVSSHLKDWFWVRNRDGNEGFIPAVVAGHGFL